MNIERQNVSLLTISDAPGLDPIDVFIVNYAPGKGRMTIRCWDRAWTCAWFAMRGQTIEAFFMEADADYIVSNMVNGLSGLRKDARKSEEAYLPRIITAVKAALAATASTAEQEGA